jgi:hypothetical protein
VHLPNRAFNADVHASHGRRLTLALGALNTMTERDSLTEWFHELATHTHEELLTLASPENIEQLKRHVAKSTPEYPLPDGISAIEFAEAVSEFRRNESAWNRATMAALIQADEMFKADRKEEAAESLEAFAASCPWALFQEAVLNQATHYR